MVRLASQLYVASNLAIESSNAITGWPSEMAMARLRLESARPAALVAVMFEGNWRQLAAGWHASPERAYATGFV